MREAEARPTATAAGRCVVADRAGLPQTTAVTVAVINSALMLRTQAETAQSSRSFGRRNPTPLGSEHRAAARRRHARRQVGRRDSAQRIGEATVSVVVIVALGTFRSASRRGLLVAPEPGPAFSRCRARSRRAELTHCRY